MLARSHGVPYRLRGAAVITGLTASRTVNLRPQTTQRVLARLAMRRTDWLITSSTATGQEVTPGQLICAADGETALFVRATEPETATSGGKILLLPAKPGSTLQPATLCDAATYGLQVDVK
jgi:hypothetical protein